MASSPKIKFYYAPGACSLAPHILLHEVGASYTPMPFSIGAQGTNITAAFAEVNPKMKVPTLVVENSTITESPAVCTIIASLALEKNLMGKEGIERVRVLEWFNYLSGTLHGGGFGHLFRPERFITTTSSSDFDSKALEAVKTKARGNIEDCFKYVESRLREGEWAVGEQFTGVDAFLLVFWRWGVAYGFGMSKYSLYSALMGRLVVRESVREVLKLEGIKSML